MMRGRHSIMDAYAEAFVTNRKALKTMLSEIIASTENIREREKANGKGPSSLCFAYPETFEEVLKELDGRNPVKSGEDTKLWEELKKAKDDLETLLTAIYSSAGISSIAFLADTDQAKSTDFLWEEDEKCWEAPSGVEHFMSMEVIESIDLGSKDYLQSPADDLNAFFYVLLYAIFGNHHTSKDLSPKEARLHSYLLSGTGRETGLCGYLRAIPRDLTSQPLIEAQPIMDEWYRQLCKVYQNPRARARIDKVLAKDAADVCRWRRSVGRILCALSGALEILRIIRSHED